MNALSNSENKMNHRYSPALIAINAQMDAIHAEAVLIEANMKSDHAQRRLDDLNHAHAALESAAIALNRIVGWEEDRDFDRNCRIADHCTALNDI